MIASRLHRQRGVSTLIVVMVLLFVVTMVAAYTSRNMIFEQRTGANYLRAANAGEVAEAGLQWALAQLNAGRMNDACVAETSPTSTEPSFRQRYVGTALDTGVLTPLALPSTTTPRSATCVFDPEALSWICSCDQDTTGTPLPPTTSRVAPAFRVRFETGLGSSATGRPGLVALNITACTRMTDDCLTSNTAGLAQEARAYVRTLLYQGGNSLVAPVAALTARGTIDATGLTVSNSRFGDSGVTVHAGGAINNIGATPGLLLNTLAGNALSGTGTTLPGDTALTPAAIPASAAASGSVAASESDRFFALVFNMLPGTARRQPAIVDLGNCGGGGCNETDLANAVALNPGRPIWVSGNLSIDSDVVIGSASSPVVLIVDDGDLSMSASGAEIHGLVYIRPPSTPGWTIPSAGLIRGAVVVDGPVVGTGGTFQIEYDGVLLKAVRASVGSFIAIPGGWRDTTRPL